MPRRPRVIIPTVAHHIIQRGNNRQNILEDPEDFSTYCFLISKYVQKYKVSVIAYCLMNNHVHFVMVPDDKSGISRLFNTVHMRYAQYKNYKRRTSGHLWQGRFYSCVLDKEHLFYAVRYVEQNPMRAQMVKRPWDYEWSSARWHVGLSVRKYIKVNKTFAVNKRDWKTYLMNKDAGIDAQIRTRTYKGNAFANDDFVLHWEKTMGCVLRELRPGPKSKKMLN